MNVNNNCAMLHPSLYSTSNSSYGAFEKPKASAYTTSGTFLSKSVDAKLSVSAMRLDAGKTALLVVSELSGLAELFSDAALPSTTVVTLKYGRDAGQTPRTTSDVEQAIRDAGVLPDATFDVVAVMDHGRDGHFSLFGDDEVDLKKIGAIAAWDDTVVDELFDLFSKSLLFR